VFPLGGCRYWAWMDPGGNRKRDLTARGEVDGQDGHHDSISTGLKAQVLAALPRSVSGGNLAFRVVPWTTPVGEARITDVGPKCSRIKR